MGQKICLTMIVKDESAVIERCLSALIPFIDYWLIIDTGSSDDTINVILRKMKNTGLRGEVQSRRWHGFSHNRSELLRQARKHYPESDYHLMIDADDTFSPAEGFKWPELDADGYHLKHMMGGMSWWRPALVKASLPWRYEGAAHEHMKCDSPATLRKINGVRIRCGNDGARRVNEPIKKYERVASQLEASLEENPDDPRAVFYLAQSYRDAKQSERALELYQRRVEMGGWIEEVWYSHMQIGVLHERLEHDWKLSEKAYMDAYDARPTRAEALIHLASLHRRLSKKKHMARVYALAAKDHVYPKRDILFIDEYTYTWRAQDEYAMAMWSMGDKRTALAVNLEMLAQDAEGLPKQRIIDNITHSRYPIARRTRPGRIAVALSTYRCHDLELFKRSVQSIIDQTYENWHLYIICDGDEIAPWEQVELPDDPRITKVALDENVGQFIIYDAMIEVIGERFFAIQDDDDMSHPERFEKLMDKMCRTNADVVFCDLNVINTDGKQVYQRAAPEFMALYPDKVNHVGSHVGLWQAPSIREIGGYFGGLRVGADTMVVGLMTKLGRPAFLSEALYTAVKNKGSMTLSPETVIDGPVRQKAMRQIYSVWKKIEPHVGKRRELSKGLLHEARAPWIGKIEMVKDELKKAIDEAPQA